MTRLQFILSLIATIPGMKWLSTYIGQPLKCGGELNDGNDIQWNKMEVECWTTRVEDGISHTYQARISDGIKTTYRDGVLIYHGPEDDERINIFEYDEFTLRTGKFDHLLTPDEQRQVKDYFDQASTLTL